MVTLLGIDESEGGGSALAEQNTPASLLCQRTGQGVPIGETSEALLEKLDEIVDVKRLPFFSQYLDGKIDERLTSSSPRVSKDEIGFRFTLKSTDSTQLIIKLKLEDLKHDFFDFFFLHGRVPLGT